MEPLEGGLYGFSTKAGVLAAKRDCEWNTAMDAMAALGELSVVSGPRAPLIDWARKSLVLVSLGSLRRGLGYDLRVTRAFRWGNRLKIEATIDASEPSLSIAETSPYQLFLVDTKAVDVVQVKYIASAGFPELRHRRTSCSIFPAPETPLEATEVSRSTWGSVKTIYR
jgi:hypothetical protein